MSVKKRWRCYVTKEILLKYWRYILVTIIAFVIGFCVCYQFFPRTVTVTPDPIVQTEVQYKETTAVQYVPKETPADSDVEITKEQPQVSVSFNGERHDFALVQNEVQKFDKGKLVVNQESTLDLNVTAQIQKQVSDGITEAFKKQQKKNDVDLGVSNQGAEVRITHSFDGNSGIYIDSTLNGQHYGAGVHFKF